MPEATCIARIKRRLASMPAAERRIADVILAEPAKAVSLTMKQLASRCEVSEGSVTNFAVRLGFEGYTAMRLALATDIPTVEGTHYESVYPSDSTREIMSKMCANSIDALRTTCETLTERDLIRAAEILLGAKRRIEVYGIGSSAMLAEDAAFRLIKLGLPAVAIRDSYIGSASALMLDPDCAALAISYTGRTHDVIKTMSIAKEKGAKTLCITCFADSPLAGLCDQPLIAVSGEAAASKLATVSRLAQLLIVDILCALIGTVRRDSAEKQSEIVDVWGEYWVESP